MDADGTVAQMERWRRWNGGADGNTPNGFLIFEKKFHGVRGATVAEHAVRRTCLPPSIDPARHESMGTGSPREPREPGEPGEPGEPRLPRDPREPREPSRLRQRLASTKMNPFLPGATTLFPQPSGAGTIFQFGLLPSFATFSKIMPFGSFVFSIVLLSMVTLRLVTV